MPSNPLNPLGIRFILIELGGLDTPFMSKAVFGTVIPDYDEVAGRCSGRLARPSSTPCSAPAA